MQAGAGGVSAAVLAARTKPTMLQADAGSAVDARIVVGGCVDDDGIIIADE
jgi:hypothetical protein